MCLEELLIDTLSVQKYIRNLRLNIGCKKVTGKEKKIPLGNKHSSGTLTLQPTGKAGLFTTVPRFHLSCQRPEYLRSGPHFYL